MKEEIVFEFGGEGGGIAISRIHKKSGIKYIYHHNEFDPTDEGLDINKKSEFYTFEEPFQMINHKYPWHLLYLLVVHDDFRLYVIEALIKKLNIESFNPANFEHSKSNLEDILNIKLKYSVNENTKKPLWTFDKINKKDSVLDDKKNSELSNSTIFKTPKIKNKIPKIWNGYCPESWLKGKTVRMRLNRNDFYESEETGLQIFVLRGVQAIIMGHRGNGEFRTTLNYGDEVENGEILSPQNSDRL